MSHEHTQVRILSDHALQALLGWIATAQREADEQADDARRQGDVLREEFCAGMSWQCHAILMEVQLEMKRRDA